MFYPQLSRYLGDKLDMIFATSITFSIIYFFYLNM